MAPSTLHGAYKYVLTPSGQPKILPVDEMSCKDEESPAEYNTGGYCPVKLNDTFKLGRYRVLRKLGWGHFSTVWLVKDTELNRHTALKVVKSAGRYAETARDEIKLLSRVSSVSPLHPGRQHIVSFLDSFAHQGPEASHICIVFEPLGEHLLALIERNKRKGVPRALVKVIAKQVLLGLEYLHDECDLVHTDIKPENILISIPDVEAHIYNELTHSPSPTSRRVGVPPPTKSRPSVSIPQTQRSRRQVQIFDSQPLASPGSRSGGPLGSHSGPNSVSGSYVSPVQMSHMAKYGATGLSTSAPKVPSGLSATAPWTLVPSSKSTPVTAANSKANSPTSPPSTSSSSSSISSIPFTTAGSVGTPPTSLSNSFGNAMAAIVHATQQSEKKAAAPSQPAPQERTASDLEASTSSNEPKPTLPSNPNPSLLSQTAPHRITSNPSTKHPLRVSAPLHTSQIPSPRPSFAPEISIKIADLGNATPSKKHFTEDIQTRQYRSPEAIIGRRDWGTRADIWSVACLVFELLTAEFLFDPQGQGDLFSKDDDHMAQIIELLGDFSLDVKMGGKYSQDLFDSNGSLRYIKTLKPWPLKRVMMEKYLWSELDTAVFCSFLEPMLSVDQRNRADAKDMLTHPWLEVTAADDVVGEW
ncbi:Pkinase-domain-containing protein [Mycena albidolilacea]|uniref:non-specific serine/threonine protein kinase n=1 Tax=Mycena albidolilacea TaxID=1033008 RepID=A0AAD7AFE5_9AGAR|nr:Pkinase-domain-containing protein [Mycena albidolilacea]